VTTYFFTEAEPMLGADRVASVINIHYLIGASAALDINLRGSMDGQSWVAVADTSVTTTGPTALAVATAPYAFVRYLFTLTTGGADGAVSFDCHAVVGRS